MQCLLVKVFGVCLDRNLLCLRHVTPGLCAVMVDGGTDFTFSVGKPTLRQHPYLLVAHNGIARVVESYFHNMTNAEYAAFGIKNCELRKFDFDE